LVFKFDAPTDEIVSPKTTKKLLRHLKFVLIGYLLAAVTACAISNRTHPDSVTDVYMADISTVAINRERAESLEADLAALDHSANGADARQIAETALQASAYLKKTYRLVRPPILHNLMVKMGLRDRGLCYHWTEDLMSYLKALQLKNYQLRWGVAYRGSNLREHNTVVITANDQPFEHGLVLDPWRHSGRLHWVVVKNDSYPWKELPKEEW
jgi:hypothetical protein